MTLGDTAVVPVLGNTGMGTGTGLAGGAAGLVGGGLLGLLAGSVLGNRGGLWGNGWNGGAAPAATAVASDIVLQPAFQSLQQQIANLNNEVDNNQILAGITSINQNVSGTSRDIGRDIANLSTSQATANFTTLNSINGLGRDLQSSATQALINNLQNFNSLQGTLVNSTNQIIAQGTANAMAMQNCCCEIKGLIQSDGNATRALINDNTIQALRDKNTELQVAVSNNAQNQYLLNTILAHLHPTAVV